MAKTTDVQTVNLIIDQGDCFGNLLEFFQEDGTTPVDVSLWSFLSQIRQTYDDVTVLASFSFSQAGYSSNQVFMSLTASETEGLPQLPATPSKPATKNVNTLIYDLKANVDGTCWYTICQGAAYVNPQVTETP